MARLADRIVTAEHALASFQEVKELGLTPVVARDVGILRFTYTFEATWKAAQLLLREIHGVTASSPKTAIRASREAKLLSDDDAAAALQMAEDRNLAAHVYNEELASALNARLAGHEVVLARWLKAMQDGTTEPRRSRRRGE